MKKPEIGKGQKNKIRKTGIVLLWLVIWQAVTLLVGNELLLAGPADTLAALCKEALSPLFWYTIVLSLLRITGGFAFAFLLGVLLAIPGCKYEIAAEFLAPFMLFCKAVPVACFAVILLIWWGAGWLSFAICFLVTLPIVYVNVTEGIKSTDLKLLEMAKVFRMSGLHKFMYIYRPAVSPFLESGIKTALGMSIKAGVAAEVIGLADNSIGGEIYMSKIYLDIAGVFAWTFVVIVLGALAERAVLLLWKAFLAWKPLWIPKKRELQKNPCLVLENIKKSFGEHNVLLGISKRLNCSEVYCLRAPSGAGKTTLLRIMAGLTKQDAGRIMDESGMDLGRAFSVSMVFQEDRLCEEETALRNVEIVCADREKAKAYLEAVLPGKATLPVKQLSGGMRRRVCMARALAAESEVLLLDEPFNGLDEDCMRKSAEFLLQSKGERILVVATHHKEEVHCLNGEIWDISVS